MSHLVVLFVLLLVDVSPVSLSAFGSDSDDSYPNALNDKLLLSCITTHKCNLLCVGMLTPTRVLVIVDQPLADDGTLLPSGCCNADEYFVFECDIPAAAGEQDLFSRRFPLSGAVLLKQKWPDLYTMLKMNFARVWPRFAVIRGREDFFLVLYSNQKVKQPLWLMNLKSLAVTEATSFFLDISFEADGCQLLVPASSLTSNFLARPSSALGLTGSGRVYRFTIDDDPTNLMVTNLSKLYASAQITTDYTPFSGVLNFRLWTHPKGSKISWHPNEAFITSPAYIGFDDGSTGTYFIDRFQASAWAIPANFDVTKTKPVPWRVKVDISQMFVLGGGVSNQGTTEYSTDLPEYYYSYYTTNEDYATDDYSSAILILSLAGSLLFLATFCIIYYCCCYKARENSKRISLFSITNSPKDDRTANEAEPLAIKAKMVSTLVKEGTAKKRSSVKSKKKMKSKKRSKSSGRKGTRKSVKSKQAKSSSKKRASLKPRKTTSAFSKNSRSNLSSSLSNK